MNTTIQTTAFSQNEITYAVRQLRRAIDSFRSGKIGEPRARMRVAELRAKYGALLPQPTVAPTPPETTGEYTERVWGISICEDCGQPQSECACPEFPPDGLSESECPPLPDPDNGPANDPPTCPGCGNQLTDGVCEYCPGICPGCGNHDCDCPLARHPGEGICGCCGESSGCNCPPHPDERLPDAAAEIVPVVAPNAPAVCRCGMALKPKRKTCGSPECIAAARRKR